MIERRVSFENPLFFYFICSPLDEEAARAALKKIPGVSVSPESHEASFYVKNSHGERIIETFGMKMVGICFTDAGKEEIPVVLAKNGIAGYSPQSGIVFEESINQLRRNNPDKRA